MITFTNSVEQTEKIGEEFAKTLQLPTTISLAGELGAGKTAFVRGLFVGLGGNPEEYTVNSPTFTLMNIYETPQGSLCHFDWYRLDKERDLSGIDMEDYLPPLSGLTVVEWGDKFTSLHRVFTYHVAIEVVDQDQRKIIIS